MSGWKPNIGFQTIALDLRYTVPELGIFGDRGGGKTGVVLADYAMNVLEHPDPVTGEIKEGPCRPWKGIVFREHYKEFETLIERTKDVYYGLFGNRDDGGRAKYLEGEKKWVFYDEKGRPYPDVFQLLFPIDHESDIDQFIGQEFQHIIWEELPQFPTLRPYFKMMASLRTGKPGIPIRVRATGNPGGPGIGQVKERFGIPDADKDAARRESFENGKYIKDPKTGIVRAYLVGLHEENIPLRKADPNYRNRVLAAVEGDAQLEKAWVHSDFSALFGKYFRLFRPEIHRVDPVEVLAPYGGVFPPYWKLDGWLDYGDGAAPTSFNLVVTSPENVSYVIAEYYDWNEYPSAHAAACEDLYRGCPYTKGRKPARVWADSQIFYTRIAAQAAQMNKRVSDVFRREAGLNVIPSNKDRMSGWRQVKELIAWKMNDEGEFTRRPQVYYFPECVNFEREMKDAVHSERGNAEDIDAGCSDHALDGFRYWAMGARKGVAPKEKKVAGAITFDDHIRRARLQRKGIYRDYGVPIIHAEQMRAAV